MRTKKKTAPYRWSPPVRCAPPAAAACVVSALTNSSLRSVKWKSLFPAEWTLIKKKKKTQRQATEQQKKQSNSVILCVVFQVNSKIAWCDSLFKKQHACFLLAYFISVFFFQNHGESICTKWNMSLGVSTWRLKSRRCSRSSRFLLLSFVVLVTNFTATDACRNLTAPKHKHPAVKGTLR